MERLTSPIKMDPSCRLLKEAVTMEAMHAVLF